MKKLRENLPQNRDNIETEIKDIFPYDMDKMRSPKWPKRSGKNNIALYHYTIVCPIPFTFLSREKRPA